jgi:Spy/CpxP family protein refolding chaperone
VRLRPRLAGLVLLLGAMAGAASAQQANPRPRDEAFKMIDAYIISNLQESLGLTDEQFAKVVPLVKRLQRDRRELAQRRMHSIQEMRQLLGSGTATEARVSELLKAVRAAEAEERSEVQRDLEAVEAALTPIQQAKYRILEIEVERKIRELMGQLRAAQKPGAQRGRRQPGDQP